MNSRVRAWVFVGLMAFAAAGLWTGCGVKTPPLPIAYAEPQKILDLRAASVKGGIALTWGRPTAYAAGGPMHNLGSFVVMRSSGNHPYQEIDRIEVTDLARFQQQQTFTYVDRGATLGQTYNYRVVSITTDGYRGAPSNEATVTRVNPTPPPNPENYVVPTPSPLP
jgi:hypothetical protein